MCDGLAAKVRAAFFGVVKHRRGHGQCIAFKRD